MNPNERFRGLVRSGRYDEACELGETFLDSGPTLDELREFWDPWGGPPSEAFAAASAAALARLAGDPRLGALATYLAVSFGVGEPGALDRLAALPPARYGWMAGWLSQRLLSAQRWDEAVRVARGALAYRPVDWTSRFRLAEALICAGDEREALDQSALALEETPAEARVSALAWHAEIDLWLGRYEQAFNRLETSCREGFYLSWTWRGAAALLLGRVDEAFALFDEALTRNPGDAELGVWRAEAFRLVGRPDAALRELAGVAPGVWPAVNAGLAAAAMGDAAGLERHFASLPWRLTEHVKLKLDLDDAGAPESKRLVLEKTVELARGFRREDYAQRVWLR